MKKKMHDTAEMINIRMINKLKHIKRTDSQPNYKKFDPCYLYL